MKTDPMTQVFLALALKWRSEGEYWCGDPADARSQHCADDLLKVLGHDKNGHASLSTEEANAVLKPYGLDVNHEPPDRGNEHAATIGAYEKCQEFAEEALKEMRHEGEWAEDPKGGVRRPDDIIIGEKVLWGVDFGYHEGFKDGAAGRASRYIKPLGLGSSKVAKDIEALFTKHKVRVFDLQGIADRTFQPLDVVQKELERLCNEGKLVEEVELHCVNGHNLWGGAAKRAREEKVLDKPMQCPYSDCDHNEGDEDDLIPSARIRYTLSKDIK